MGAVNRARRPTRTARAAACAIATLLIATTGAAGQIRVPAAGEVDAVFAEFDATSPGCMLGVILDGRVVHSRGYGSANLDYRIPNGPEIVYYVGSVSKQFTAAAVALLALRGELSLDDDVRRFIPELPDYGRTMTVRHLVHHTSGLRDIYTLMSLAGIRMEDVLTDEDALGLITRQRELNFLPGDDYLYSNSGYWLLGQIVERVTGRTLRQFTHDEIFAPLGMTNTHFHDNAREIVRNRAMSYAGIPDDFRVAYLSNFDKVGAGGLYTTLADLARWDANFYQPTLGGTSFIDLMHSRGVLTGGDTLVYAFGINVQQRNGLPVVRHSGSLMGFRADLVRYPEQRFTVATMCNHSLINAAAYADRVTDLYLGPLMRPATATAAAASAGPGRPAAQPHQPAAGSLELLAGRYYSEELDATYTVSAGADGLTLTRRLTGTQRMAASPEQDVFTVGGQTFRFLRDGDGRVASFTVEAGRVRNIRFTRQYP
ncbi:MAG TPA: serine hydrolase domain-containing protein [Longimicrobiales bacterium]|nr:serine hydrolase domain-containing protein [Longimicrobiales bacterium]